MNMRLHIDVGDAPVARRMARQGGFTLIELMVVTLIMGILAGIMMPRLDETRQRAHFASINQDFRNLAASQERYHQTNYSYALNLAQLDFALSEGVEVEVTEATAQGWAAIGTHVALEPGKGCSVYLGNAGAPPLPSGAAHGSGVGVVECAR